jgi:hypothetical protein
MIAELPHLPDRGGNSDSQDTVLAGRQGFVAPNLAPAILGRRPLEIGVEVFDVNERAVHISVAQHLVALGEATIVNLLVHRVFPLKLHRASNAFLVFNAFQISRTDASGYAL